jgi:hypothetical protein
MVTPKERDTYTACRYLVPWQRIAKHLRINSARVIFEKNHSQQQGERNLGRAHVRRKKKPPFTMLYGTHPQHTTDCAHGWVKKGQNKESKTNSGRQRVNINCVWLTKIALVQLFSLIFFKNE